MLRAWEGVWGLGGEDEVGEECGVLISWGGLLEGRVLEANCGFVPVCVVEFGCGSAVLD